MTMKSAPASAACERITSATSMSPSDGALDLNLEPVPREMLCHIGALDLVLLAALVGDDDDLDLARLLQQRHGVGDGARGGAAAVPAHHDAVELERILLNIGNDDHRPAGLEQGGFGDHLFHGALSGLGLPDNRQIEAPRDTAELVADAGEAGAERKRLGGHARRACMQR